MIVFFNNNSSYSYIEEKLDYNLNCLDFREIFLLMAVSTSVSFMRSISCIKTARTNEEILREDKY